MFSGIVESAAPILRATHGDQTLRVVVQRPEPFNDLKAGDSVAVNGICLTLEEPTGGDMHFTLAAETLEVTGWTAAGLSQAQVNLERSMRVGDRLHGHWVTGHVDGMGQVVERQSRGEAVELVIAFPQQLKPFFWNKGSCAINGVSLTINQVQGSALKVCLIPETLRRTNLAALTEGSPVTVEVDWMARGLVQMLEGRGGFKA